MDSWVTKAPLQAATPRAESSTARGKRKAIVIDLDDTSVSSSSSQTSSCSALEPLNIRYRLPPREINHPRMYIGQKFLINWQKLRLPNRLPLSGDVGYKVRTKKRCNNADSYSPIWRHGAWLEQVKEGKVIDLWLCRICHEMRRFETGLYVVNGYNSIYHHLLSEHKIAYEQGVEIKFKEPKHDQSTSKYRLTSNKQCYQAAPFVRPRGAGSSADSIRYDAYEVYREGLQ